MTDDELVALVSTEMGMTISERDVRAAERQLEGQGLKRNDRGRWPMIVADQLRRNREVPDVGGGW